jgi:peptidoglycan hydrolase CwlO-like protein
MGTLASVYEKENARQTLQTELSLKDTMFNQLQSQLKGAESQIISLKNDIRRGKDEIEALELRLLPIF